MGLDVELFVADRSAYQVFLGEILSLNRIDYAEHVCAFQDDRLRIILHEGHADLPAGHPFAAPLANRAPRGLGVEIILPCADIDTAHRQVVERLPAFTATALEARPWGVRDFRIVTPDGYYLRLTEPQR